MDVSEPTVKRVAARLPKETMVAAEKPRPLIVTVVPPEAGPVEGTMAVTTGATAAVTVRLSGTVCVTDAAVPATVSGYAPVATLPLTLKVSAEVPPAGTEAGTKAAVTPLGKLLTESEIVSAEPDTRTVLIELVPGTPGAAATVAGIALKEKLFATGAAKAPDPLGVPMPVGPS